jgi:hypothetical protein
VEAPHVLGVVVEAVLRGEAVVHEVREAGVRRHLHALLVHAVEQRRQLVALLEVRARADPERPLAHRAVRALEERLQLRDGLALPVPFRREAADDLLVRRRQLLQLGEQGHVRLAEDLRIGAETAQRGLEIGPRPAQVEQPPGEPHLLLVELGKDLGREAQVGRLLRRVRRVAGVGDHRQRAGLAHQRVQPRPGRQPFLHLLHAQGRGVQRLVVGRHVVPCGTDEDLGGGRKLGK